MKERTCVSYGYLLEFSFDRLSRETDIVGYPILPLVQQLVAATPVEMAKYIHWGATTQDIMDNASILQIREALEIVCRELDRLTSTLEKLSRDHRDR